MKLLTDDGLNLIIFDRHNFIIDKKLPKYFSEEDNKDLKKFGTPESWSDTNSIVWSGDIEAAPDAGYNGKRIKSKRKFFDFLTIKKKEKKKVDIQTFFNNIKSNIKVLYSTYSKSEKYNERVDAYIKAIENATAAGQTALCETLKKQLDAVKYENILYAAGDVKIITEEQVITFIKESEKGIRIDWIKNFSRIIPEKIIARKKQIDELKVFDNYVVMSYDPDGKSWKETEEEINKRRDPILFGVIKGIDKLYHIGSWEDEYCNLTIDTFIEKFGAGAINMNDISVKF